MLEIAVSVKRAAWGRLRMFRIAFGSFIPGGLEGSRCGMVL